MSLFSGNLSMRTIDLLEKGMDSAVLRRQVLANNIANVSVPHFKRSEVSFESDLKRAIESQQAALETAPLRTDDPRHLVSSPFRVRDYQRVHPRVHIDYLSTMRNDGNNVDMEQESMKIVRNQLHYNLMANRIGAHLRELNQLLRLA